MNTANVHAGRLERRVRRPLSFDGILPDELTWLEYASAKTPIALLRTYLLLILQHVQHHAVLKRRIQVHESSLS